MPAYAQGKSARKVTGAPFTNDDPRLVALADKYGHNFTISGDGNSHPGFGSGGRNFDIRSWDGRFQAFMKTPEGKQFRRELREAGYDVYFEQDGATSSCTGDHFTINRTIPKS